MGVAPPVVSEREFLAQVIEVAHLFGWTCAHFRPAWTGRGWRTPVQADGAGFPDLLMVRGNRIVAAELKAGRGKATPEQAEWLAMLAAAGAETHVWKSDQFEEVARVLR